MTDEYISLKKSPVMVLQKIPLYYFSKQKEPLLYKKKGEIMDEARFQSDKFPDLFIHKSDIEKMGICAILHDIGLTEVPQEILQLEDELMDNQFKQFKTHCLRGEKLIREGSDFGDDVALVVLEHHEKLDGSGYPSGKTKICEEANLIGMIDSYEYLTYREKNFRRAQKPFGSLQILKKDVMAY
ncbi:MAG: HD domain-containing protein [Desulfobacteraceae bacterium]|nr:HD domain-containing protein [Desulfobacteraceae bacterium]